MSQFAETHGAENEACVDIQELQHMDDGYDESYVMPGAARPPTGDDAVDEVLAQLDAVTDQPLDTQIEVGEEVHRILQGRLTDLGKE